MEKTNKLINNKTDIILDAIKYIKYMWDEENDMFNVNMIPKQTPKHIDVNFTIKSTGNTFK